MSVAVVALVVVDEEIQGGFVLYYVGKATDGSVEAVVLLVVVDRRNLTDEDAAAAPPEAVIEVGRESDALAGSKDDCISGADGAAHAVHADGHRTLGQAPVVCRIVEPDDEIAAPTIDDVLGLGPVKVHGRDLIGVDDHDLFGIDLALFDLQVFRGAVAQGKEEETQVQVVALAKVSDIPTESVVNDLADLRALAGPVFRAPLGKGGQAEVALPEKCVGVAHDGVDL